MYNYHTILLAEDERDSANMLTDYLEAYGYKVFLAYDGTHAKKLINKYAGEIHVAALDIMMPGLNGIELCTLIREHTVLKHIPVLLITAKDQERHEIEGLSRGADAYITKPAGVKLVKARINALLRRQNPKKTTWVEYGSYFLDITSTRLFVADEEIHLTPIEFNLLKLFFQNPNKVFTREQILNTVFKKDPFIFDRTVDVHIGNLRRKLNNKEIIQTFRGHGYGFKAEKLEQI